MSYRPKNNSEAIGAAIANGIIKLVGLIFRLLWKGIKALFALLSKSKSSTPGTPPPLPTQRPSRNDQDLDSLCQQATKIAEEGNFLGGTRLLLDALKQHPNSGLLNLALGMIHLNTVSPKELNNNEPAEKLLGRWHSGEWQAITYLERAVALEPTNEDCRTFLGFAWSNLALAFRTTEDWENADLAYCRWFVYSPEYKSKNGIYALYAADKMQETFEARRDQGMQFDNAINRSLAILERANHALNEDDYGVALHRFASVLVLDPNNVNALLGNAQCTLRVFEYNISPDGLGPPANQADKNAYIEMLTGAVSKVAKAKEYDPSAPQITILEAKLDKALSMVR